MDSLFLIKLLLSVAVGGVWVAVTTLAAEKLGGKLGGLLGGLPSTVLVSYFFIAWVQGDYSAYEATSSFPLSYTISALSTFIYVLLPLKNLYWRLVCYGLSWCALQSLLIFFVFQHYGLSLLLWGLFLLIFIIYVKRFGSDIYQRGESQLIQSKLTLPVRMLISATIIGAAVLMSQFGGPILASIFAAFPGVFLSTIIIADRYVSYDFARSLLLPLVLSGSLNCVAFIAVFRIFIVDRGYLLATGIALLAVLVTTLVAHLMIRGLIRSKGLISKA